MSIDSTLARQLRRAHNDAKLYEALASYRQELNVPVHVGPFNLNLDFFRGSKVGVWDDLAVMWCTDTVGRPVVQVSLVSTDAWDGEWTDPTHPDGCIYTLDGYVAGGFYLGEFRGRPALLQRADFPYVRWVDRGRVPTVRNLELRANKEGVRFYAQRGTHWHNQIGRDSPAKPKANTTEGCTLSLYAHEHDAQMGLVRSQMEHRGTSIVSPNFRRVEALERYLATLA